MSAVGKRIWLYMQESEPRYSQRALSRKWKNDGTLPITPQSISNYLYRAHPPADFVNAVVKEFKLNLEQELELHWLYFHGGGRGPSLTDLLRAHSIEQEADERASGNGETGDAAKEKR